MTVPGSRSVPGAELVARVQAYAPDPATTIVVHCAGRTRSIIGAQSLIDAGVPNRVVALRDGTIGWTLAGLELDARRHGRCRPHAAPPTGRRAGSPPTWPSGPASRPRSAGELADLLAAGRRTVVPHRRPDPRRARRRPSGGLRVGARRAARPGDRGVPPGARRRRRAVRRRRGAGPHDRVLAGPDGLGRSRADRTPRSSPARAPSRPDGLPDVPWVTAAELADAPAGPVVDVSPSTTYARGHVPGAVWATRRDLVESAELDGAVVVSEDGAVAAFAAAEATARRGARLGVLAGGTAAWRDAGHDVTARRRQLAIDAGRRVRAAVRRHVGGAGGDAGLPRLGARPRRPAGARRHPPLPGPRRPLIVARAASATPMLIIPIR